MSLILISLLFSLVLMGWAFFFVGFLKTDFSCALLNATSFMSLVVFMGFLLVIPQWVSVMTLGLGLVFLIYFFAQRRSKPVLMIASKFDDSSLWVYFILCLICIVYAYGMKFRSIDDYSFWGVMSKYLFVFKTLPHQQDFISANFLSYTPLMACFHYLLYTLANQYAQFLGYFAQGLVLISALMVFFDSKNMARSIVYLSVVYILLGLAYGSVFARMEVDAYVAATFLAITWLIYKKGQDAFFIICIPLLFLSVIKEIALFFALSLLVLFILLEAPRGRMRFYCFALFIGLLALKFTWVLHVRHYGFHSFSQAVSLNLALSALNPFNQYYHVVQTLFLKEIVFSNFDHLIKVPYCFMYLVISVLWYFLIKKAVIPRRRVMISMCFFVSLSFIYLLMLYFLQAIVFDVGHENIKILDFQRYYNILFLPWLSFTVLMCLDALNPSSLNNLSHPVSISIVIFALILLIGGKIERMRKFYQPNNLYGVYSAIDAKISSSSKKNMALCLFNPPPPYYQIHLPLVYFLMPHRVYYPMNLDNRLYCDLVFVWKGNQ